MEGSRAKSQIGARSNNSRNESGEDLETNPTSDRLRLKVFRERGSDRVLLLEGSNGDVGEHGS